MKDSSLASPAPIPESSCKAEVLIDRDLDEIKASIIEHLPEHGHAKLPKTPQALEQNVALFEDQLREAIATFASNLQKPGGNCRVKMGQADVHELKSIDGILNGICFDSDVSAYRMKAPGEHRGLYLDDFIDVEFVKSLMY